MIPWTLNTEEHFLQKLLSLSIMIKSIFHWICKMVTCRNFKSVQNFCNLSHENIPQGICLKWHAQQVNGRETGSQAFQNEVAKQLDGRSLIDELK